MEKIKITPDLPPGGIKIKHVGLLDLLEFYKWLKKWFDFNGYGDTGKYFNEEFYSEEISQGEKDIEIRWTGKKAKDSYVTYIIEVMFLLLRVSNVEVQRGNRKIKMQNGEFEIRISAYIEKGPSGPLYLRMLYESFIIRRRLQEYKDDLYGKTYSLSDEIKEFFNQYVR